TCFPREWSSDVCSSDLAPRKDEPKAAARRSLAQRITDVNPALAASLSAGSYGAARRKAAAAEPADEQAPVNDAQEQAPSPQLNRSDERRVGNWCSAGGS